MADKVCRRFLLWGLCITVTVIAAITGYIISATNDSIDRDEGIAVAAIDMEKLEENCTVNITYHYKLCNHTIEKTEKLPEELVGKDKAAAAAFYKDYQFTAFSANKICIEKTFNTYCDKHFILKSEGNNVWLYRTIAETGDLAQYRKIGMDIQTLTDSEKDALLKGKVFPSLEAVEEYLESVES